MEGAYQLGRVSDVLDMEQSFQRHLLLHHRFVFPTLDKLPLVGVPNFSHHFSHGNSRLSSFNYPASHQQRPSLLKASTASSDQRAVAYMVREMGFLGLEPDSDNGTMIGKDDTSTEHIELSMPSADSIITVPITTFHLFTTLPNELQLLIWFHAIGYLHLDMNFVRHLSNSRSSRYLRLSRFELITYATRITLMATCRLTRMLALQAMRKDITRIWISLAFPEHKVEHLRLSQWSVLKVVDGCIKEVKARMGDKPFKQGLGIIMW